MITIEYGETWRITPTAAGRLLIEQHTRVMDFTPVADARSTLRR